MLPFEGHVAASGGAHDDCFPRQVLGEEREIVSAQAGASPSAVFGTWDDVAAYCDHANEVHDAMAFPDAVEVVVFGTGDARHAWNEEVAEVVAALGYDAPSRSVPQDASPALVLEAAVAEAAPLPSVVVASDRVREVVPFSCAVAGLADLCLPWVVGVEAAAVARGFPVLESCLSVVPVLENVLEFHLYLEIAAPLDQASYHVPVPRRRIDHHVYLRAEISDQIVVAGYSFEAQKSTLVRVRRAASRYCVPVASVACHYEKDAVAPSFDCS